MSNPDGESLFRAHQTLCSGKSVSFCWKSHTKENVNFELFFFLIYQYKNYYHDVTKYHLPRYQLGQSYSCCLKCIRKA